LAAWLLVRTIAAAYGGRRLALPLDLRVRHAGLPPHPIGRQNSNGTIVIRDDFRSRILWRCRRRSHLADHDGPRPNHLIIDQNHDIMRTGANEKASLKWECQIENDPWLERWVLRAKSNLARRTADDMPAASHLNAACRDHLLNRTVQIRDA
jgi:hypothetical protein